VAAARDPNHSEHLLVRPKGMAMSSWTADIEWTDLVGTHDDFEHWTRALQEYSGVIRVDDVTGATMATITLEASSLAAALQVALELVEGVVGQGSSLRRIAGSDAYAG
jgi:hypothetical protein